MTRIRNKSTEKPVGKTQHVHSYNPDAEDVVITTDWVAVENDWMVDVVTPGFRKAQREGGIVISPMTRLQSWYTVTAQPSTDRVTGGPPEGAWPYGHSTRTIGPWRAPRDFTWMFTEHSSVVDKIARVESLAITGAYAKVGEPDFETLTELAELRETLSFLYSPVKAAVAFTKRGMAWLSYVERAQAKHVARVNAWERKKARLGDRLKTPPPAPLVIRPFKVGKYRAVDIPSFWLAYRYGIMPLVYSFQDIQKALKNQIENPATDRATARQKRGEVMELPQEVFSWDTIPGAYLKETTDYKLKVTSRAGVLYTMKLDVQAKWGLHLHYVPVAMYETIPLSFVADWFWSASDAYKAWTASLRADTILGAWVVTTVKMRAEEMYEVLPSFPESDAYVYSEPLVRPQARYDYSWKRRRSASLQDVSVQLKVDLNLKRIADGLALIYTLLDSRIGKRR